MTSKTRSYAWLLIICVCLPACRSKGIDVTIQNNSPVPIRNVEVDYPGAAFGAPIIAPGNSYWYHIKPSDNGNLSIAFEIENGKPFRQKGPAVHAGEGGKILLIVYEDASGHWRVRAETLTQP